jgi:uncharacterized caspase-like protein
MAAKLALLIGLSEYKDSKLPKLAAPLADVRALGELLRRVEICNFDAVETLVNGSIPEAQQKIAKLCDGGQKDDFILLYFSAHRLIDFSGDLYFAFPETMVDELYWTAMSSHFVREVLNKSRSRRQILILDCCHSGAFAAHTKGVRSPAITRDTFEVDGYGREVLTSNWPV